MLISGNEFWESTIPTFKCSHSKIISEINRMVTEHWKSFQEDIFLLYIIMCKQFASEKIAHFPVFVKYSANWLLSHWSNKIMKLFSVKFPIQNPQRYKVQQGYLVWFQDFGLWRCQCKCMVLAWQKSERSPMKASNLLCDTIMQFSSDGPLQQSLWIGELSNVSSIASKYT